MLVDAHTHHESPWPHVRVLSSDELRGGLSAALVCAGVHPWDVARVLDSDRDKLRAWALDPRCVAIGETGLDRLRPSTWDEQQEWFRWQWELAEDRQKPVVLHAVHANADILGILKSWRPTTPWLWHAFAGPVNVVQEILRHHHHMYFSFGPREARRSTFTALWDAIPPERRLLETDDSRGDLTALYEQVGASKELLSRNFKTLFGVG